MATKKTSENFKVILKEKLKPTANSALSIISNEDDDGLKLPISKQIWRDMGGALVLSTPSSEHEALENALYRVGISDQLGWYLVKVTNQFEFDYKLYGLESKFIDRVIKTYKATMNDMDNLGVLLNGIKGTGKTVTGKILANKLKQPVIIVSRAGCSTFINSIPQNITVLLDEYEKTFTGDDSRELLTIMDGVSNSIYRRVFILTTNKLSIDENLLERPTRIRYFKSFTHLSPEIVEQIIDDFMLYKEFKDETIKFISQLEVITIDIVKSIIREINIHNEGPESFVNVFNVKKLKGKFNILAKDANGNFTKSIASDCQTNARPDFGEGLVDNWLQINSVYVGRVSKVLSWNTLEVIPIPKNKETPAWLKKGPVELKITSNVMHYNYTYGRSKGMQPEYSDNDEYGDYN